MIEIKHLLRGVTLQKLPVGGGTIGNADIGRLGITGFSATDFSL